DSLDEEGKNFLDPNGQSEDGTTALRAYDINHDARYLAYGIRLYRLTVKPFYPASIVRWQNIEAGRTKRRKMSYATEEPNGSTSHLEKTDMVTLAPHSSRIRKIFLK
ncbi:prolyl endopeptidase-like protein, partial [Tanacetum coccineum]